ncbi:S4 domain-containing protein [Komagataeibacter xylinus]|uniref:RNA-binding S4 domain-containing protein n=1 Tax=Komagataeibacter xylinus TaxID=28448 RepID=A0A857FIZ7_KOMXY|nr:S4 domain-containing protein [Komagataeibacter xylinus]QHC34133.1 hypothetical protein FMA36_00140 [Komagataeibacter xylinus]
MTLFPLSSALCRLGLAGSPQEAQALIRLELVRIDGDRATASASVGYGVTISLRNGPSAVVSRQAMGVR